MDLSLPPSTNYNSFKELETAAQAHARTAGYVFNVGKPKSHAQALS
jgi:hypothetical protein